MSEQTRRDLDLRLGGFGRCVAAFGDALEALLLAGERLHVGEHQLGLDGLDVGDRMEVVLDVDDVRVLEAADDLDDRVHLADVGEELVAQPFAGSRPLDEAGDVDQLDGGRHEGGRSRDRRDRLQALVGNRDDADIRLDGAERIVRRLGLASAGKGVEQRRLADVRQADNAGTEHDGNPWLGSEPGCDRRAPGAADLITLPRHRRMSRQPCEGNRDPLAKRDFGKQTLRTGPE